MKPLKKLRLFLFLLSASILLLPGCAATYLSCMPDESRMDNVSAEFSEGTVVLTSIKEKTAVMISIPEQKRKASPFRILLTTSLNPGVESNANLLVGNISVTGVTDKGEDIAFETIDPDAYIKKQQRKQAWSEGLTAALIGLNQGLNEYNYESGQTSYYEYQKNQNDIAAQTNTMVEQSQRAQAEINHENKELLRNQTLNSDKSFTEGNVFVKKPSKDYKTFIITVPLGAETHQFVYNVREKQM